MESWPTSILPDPLLELDGENDSNATRTQMASGRIQQRRRFSLDLHTMSARWRLTEDQFALFQSFVYYKLSGGSDWFELDMKRGGGLKTYKVRMVDGKYQYRLNSPHWDVSARLEVEEQNYVPEAELDESILEGDLVVPPSTQSFSVVLAEGDVSKTITFPVSFGSLGIPPAIKVQLVSPEGGFVFEVVVRDASPSVDGFIADLGAAVPGPGYSLQIIASHTIA